MVSRAAVSPLPAVEVTVAKFASFAEAFGKLGPLVLFVAIVSMLWTIWLICLNIAPNATANYLMDTGKFDNGEFWLILQPEPVLLVFTVLSLSTIVIIYGMVILRMTIWRNKRPSALILIPTSDTGIASQLRSGIQFIKEMKWMKKALATWKELTGFNGRHRKQWVRSEYCFGVMRLICTYNYCWKNAILKAVDLTLQMLTLHRILEYGFSPKLCFGYAALVATNALSCVVFILNPHQHSAYGGAGRFFVSDGFDMLFAVGAPIMLLEYSYIGFQFDCKRAMLVYKIMSLNSYERQARLIANQREVNNFLLCFDALRTNTWRGLAVQTVMNVSFGYRLLRVVQVYGEYRRQIRGSHRSNPPQTTSLSNKRIGTINTATSVAIHSNIQARVPRVLALTFLAVGVMAIVLTHESIDHSTQACKAYPECAAFAYRWVTHQNCPCLVYIDVLMAPKTWDEWKNPVDVTASVSELARSGDLLVLNIINRRLRMWPDELSRCTNLRHISLLYTGVEEIPSWAAGFTRLEFLNIEGKHSETNLVKMPSNLFDRMHVLSRIHLGSHYSLHALPSMDGLVNMRSLSIAMLPSLSSFPSLATLSKLHRLLLLILPSLHTLSAGPPTVPPAVEIQLTGVCCSGFLGNCDLTYASCRDLKSCERPADAQWTLWSAFRAANSELCHWDASVAPIPILSMFPDLRRADVDECDGRLYRQCEPQVPAHTLGQSLCYNDRLRVISCVASPEVIALRRAEIQQGVGLPCDPEDERWLGCTAD